MDRLKHFSMKFFKWFFGILGILSFVFLILSFTDLPYYAYHYLGTCNSKLYRKPDLIVLMGGAGMPSPDGLMRSYYATEAAKEFPEAKIIIALPYNEADSLQQLDLLANELKIRGVDSSRISYEPMGFNTHSQAQNIAAQYDKDKERMSVLLVTSPEHMYRSVKTFQRVGFAYAGGVPAFEDPVDEEKVMDRARSKDTRVKSVDLRYNMWSYMQYELLVLREYCAISYYKIKGWI